MNNTYEIDYKIKYSEVDSNYKFRYDYIVSLFEDVTGLHSKELGVDGKTLLENSNAFWILTKIKLKFFSVPSFDDLVNLETWPLPPGSIRFIREYSMSCGGKKAVAGSSEWCTMDYTTRRVIKANTISYPLDMKHREETSGAGDFIKIKETLNEQDFNHIYRSSFVDIDSNKHTNNVAYLRMALNCFSPDEFAALDVDELQINFISQTFYDDEITLYKKSIDNGFYIEGQVDEKSVFNCIITLK